MQVRRQLDDIIQLSEKMATTSDYTEELRSAFFILENNIKGNEQKIQSQHKIYTDLYRVFLKHANKLATVANSINEEVLQAVNQEELTVQYYQMLSNSILRLADCSRRVSLRLKSEILDPLKTFSENYDNVYEDIRRQFQNKIGVLNQQDQDTQKYRETYNLAGEKFEKHREMQKKVIEKIESGSKSQLEKFNSNTKKLTQGITSAEKFYISSVEKMNLELQTSRKEFAIINQSISYNEDTRRSFFRKTIINSIKTFQEFGAAYDPDTVRKLQQSSKSDFQKFQDLSQRKIRTQLEKIISSDFREEFVSYDELMKSKKKKLNQEDSSHLTEYFNKLSNKEKKLIQELLQPWFVVKAPKKMSQTITLSSAQEAALFKTKSFQGLLPSKEEERKEKSIDRFVSDKDELQMDAVKGKILSNDLPHCFYFVELLYGRIVEMTSFYCKLSEQNFLFLLNAFSNITKHLDISSDIGIEFIFKMMIVSQRIMLKKNISKRSANQPIELLCHQYGKTGAKFKEPKLLAKLLQHIEKRKANKKKSHSENKGPLNIAKGFLAAFGRPKAPTLTDDQQYNCLQEMIILIANFSVPNQIILPFIKEALGNSHQSAYQYLKSIILLKKDVQERHSLFYRREIKEKKEELMKKAIEGKKMGEYIIKIVAQHGFLGMEELEFRTICKGLKDIHHQILAKLRLPTEKKWIRLIPVDHKLDYISMKHEVAQKSVPSAVEEIITLDVNRSLHLHGQCLNPTILHSLLRIYAYFHQDISYCQGMNYLAGYLYLKTKNEESTYRIFEYIMQIRFKEIFVNQFEVLKVKMYQFQRLLAIFHPEISEHFKRQSITPECYVVSWIITLFASSYQYTMESYLIDVLWERFIIWGWTEFFKFVLWVFELYKEDLVELTYDKALHFLGELGRSELFLADEKMFKERFEPKMEDPRKGIDRYQVSQDLLNKFTNEYNLDQE